MHVGSIATHPLLKNNKKIAPERMILGTLPPDREYRRTCRKQMSSPDCKNGVLKAANHVFGFFIFLISKQSSNSTSQPHCGNLKNPLIYLNFLGSKHTFGIA